MEGTQTKRRASSRHLSLTQQMAFTTLCQESLPGPIKSVTDIIGSWGPFQRRIFIFFLSIYITSPFQNLNLPFIAPKLDFWCLDGIQQLNTSTSSSASFIYANETSSASFRYANETSSKSFRYTNETSSSGSFRWENETSPGIETKNSCSAINFTKSGLNETKLVTSPCGRFKYDHSHYQSTIVEEFDLVCDRSWIPSLAQSVHQIGYAVSGVTFGLLSDKFGRLVSFKIALALEIIAGLAQAFSPSIYLFIVARFFVGAAAFGRFLNGYVLMMEWVGPEIRGKTAIFMEYGYASGYVLLPLVYYLFPHFRIIQITISCLQVIWLVLSFLLIPESPRWQLIHKKYNEAIESIKRACFYNCTHVRNQEYDDDVVTGKIDQLLDFTKKEQQQQHNNNPVNSSSDNSINNYDHGNGNVHSPISNHENIHSPISNHGEGSDGQMVESSDVNECDKSDALQVDSVSEDYSEEDENQTIFDLWRVPSLLRLSLILYYSWFAQAFIFYGSIYNIGNLGGDVFVNFTIFGLSYYLSNTFLLLMMERFGRKKLLMILFSGELAAFIGMFSFSFHHHHHVVWTRVTFAFIGNFCVSGAYNIVYLFTAESFPTTMRQVGIGSCSISARIGTVIAPFVKELTSLTHLSITFVIFGGLALINIILVCFVPETKGQDLPDTIRQKQSKN